MGTYTLCLPETAEQFVIAISCACLALFHPPILDSNQSPL
jgi:hypothetical protein